MPLCRNAQKHAPNIINHLLFFGPGSSLSSSDQSSSERCFFPKLVIARAKIEFKLPFDLLCVPLPFDEEEAWLPGGVPACELLSTFLSVFPVRIAESKSPLPLLDEDDAVRAGLLLGGAFTDGDPGGGGGDCCCCGDTL